MKKVFALLLLCAGVSHGALSRFGSVNPSTFTTASLPLPSGDTTYAALSANQSFTGANSFTGSPGVSASSNVVAASFYGTAVPIPTNAVGYSTFCFSSSNVNLPGTGTFGDFCSVRLSSGNWAAYYQGRLNNSNGTTDTDYEIGISSVTGNFSTNLVNGDNWLPTAYPALAANQSTVVTIAGWPFTELVSGTTYYAKFEATYGGGQPVQTGVMRFIRR